MVVDGREQGHPAVEPFGPGDRPVAVVVLLCAGGDLPQVGQLVADVTSPVRSELIARRKRWSEVTYAKGASSSSVRLFETTDGVADHVGLSVQTLLVEAPAGSLGS